MTKEILFKLWKFLGKDNNLEMIYEVSELYFWAAIYWKYIL